MKRPTIPDLANEARVSISTVNRVINGSASVKKRTREHVLVAARRIGFYGLGAMEHSFSDNQAKTKLAVLLPPHSRHFYRDIGVAMSRAAANFPEQTIKLTVDHIDDPTPEQMATRLLALAEDADSLALVGAQHPLIIDAVEEISSSGKQVTGLIAPLSTKGNCSFVGIDNWAVGRTAAWAFDKMVHSPGKIGILVGSHRYRNQDLNESGFRSYFREFNESFKLLEPLSTYESASVARERVQQLLSENPDMCGLLISGGGITGALSALREFETREDFVTVGYELFDTTRTALLDRTLTMAIAHPIDALAHATISTMVQSRDIHDNSGAQQTILEFDVYTSENIGGRQSTSH